MKNENYKFRKYIAVLLVVMTFMAASKIWGAETDESKNIRQPETAHYATLSKIDGKPQTGQENLDSQTFPLSEWGPLMSWKLFKTYYADQTAFGFPKICGACQQFKKNAG